MRENEVIHEDQKLISTLASGMLWVVMGMVIARILGYGIRAVIAQTYGVEKYGYINTALSLMVIFSMLSLAGLNTALARQISYYRARSEIESVKNQIFSAYKIALSLGLAFGIFLFMISGYLAEKVFRASELTMIIQIFAIGLPLFNLLEMNTAVYKGLKEIFKFTLYHEVLRFFIIFIIVLVLVLLDKSFTVVVMVYPISYLIIDTWTFFDLRHKSGLLRIGSIFWNQSDKKILAFSLPILFGGMFWFLMPRTDTILIGILLDQNSVGLYNGAVPVAQLLLLVREAFSPVILPLFTELYATSKLDKLSVLYVISSKWMMIFIFPLFISMLILPEFFIEFIFGKEFITVVPVLRVLIFGYTFHVIMGPLSNLLIISGFTKKVMLNSFITFVLSITLNLLLIPKFGLMGAAISSASAFIVFNLLCFIPVYEQIKTHPFRLLYLKFISAGIIPIPILLDVFISGWMIPKILLYFACYAGLLILFRSIKNEDLVVLDSIKRKLKSK